MAFENTEMKDIILATLAEIENDIDHSQNQSTIDNVTLDIKDGLLDNYTSNTSLNIPDASSMQNWKQEEINAKAQNTEGNQEQELADILSKLEDGVDNEYSFLSGMRERLLVLFEGLKDSPNKKLENKLNLTMSYLGYTLALIDERLERKNKKSS